MTIRQGRYIVAETEQEKKVRVTEIQRAEEDPFIRRSEVQQKVNNSTLPVSSRAVNLAIESINSNLDLKADKTELEGLVTEDYVNEKIDEKEIGITEPELVSKSVGSGKWIRQTELDKKWDVQETVGNSTGKVMREGAYGLGVPADKGVTYTPQSIPKECGIYNAPSGTEGMPIHANGAILSIIRGSSGYGQEIYFADSQPLVYGRQIYRGAAAGAWFSYLTSLNTSTDRNGVLHTGTKTPLDTLNVSDMVDTVVDNDLLTVTSGAVFRAIKQLTDQIISLEARVREIEDGGI